MRAFKNSRVVVLVDDKHIREYLTDVIRGWDLCAEGFALPEAAFENIREIKCDIILLDVFISDVCRLDLIPQFAGDLKIIALTGFADQHTAIRALKLGAFDWLEKPLEIELFYHSILRALRTLKTERESKRFMDDLEKTRSELHARQQRLKDMNTRLHDVNKALSIFAQNNEPDREEIEKRIASRLRNLIMPMVVKLRDEQAFHRHEVQLNNLTMQIEDLTSGFAIDTSVAMTLSSTEIRVASLTKNGIKAEEIARQLHISESTVRTHRKNIRKKLKIDNTRYSLRNFLTSTPREASNGGRNGSCSAIY